MKCVCIDDSNMPIDFPLPSQWVKKGEIYTAIRIKYIKKSNKLGVMLSEKCSLDYTPYLYYALERFSFDKDFISFIQENVEKTEEDLIFEPNKILEENYI